MLPLLWPCLAWCPWVLGSTGTSIPGCPAAGEGEARASLGCSGGYKGLGRVQDSGALVGNTHGPFLTRRHLVFWHLCFWKASHDRWLQQDTSGPPYSFILKWHFFSMGVKSKVCTECCRANPLKDVVLSTPLIPLTHTGLALREWGKIRKSLNVPPAPQSSAKPCL